MGVPQFFRYLRDRYGLQYKNGKISAFQTQVPGRVSSLAMDMNSLFHQAAAKVYAYDETIPKWKRSKQLNQLKKRTEESLQEELFKTILKLLKNVVMQVRPQDTLIVAVDGMAPMAKIQQQRQRRYKSAKEKKSGAFFDSNAFSPGTKLMIELDDYLKRNLKLHNTGETSEGEGLWLPPKVIYSGHLVPGEGEHKIMDFYRDGNVEGDIAKNGGSHVIHGLDADLIMLSMLLPQERVFLMREDISDILSIQRLREQIQLDLGTSTAVDDFLVLMYFIGNDFLPRVKTLDDVNKGLDIAFEVYRKVGKSLSRDHGSKIDFVGLFYFLVYFHQYEPYFAQELGRVDYGQFPSLVLENSTKKGKVDFTLFRNNWYHYALAPPTTSQSLISAFHIEDQNILKPSKDEISSMCVEYLSGMAWTSLYYRGGMKSVNTNWSYPYFHAPLLSDLKIIVHSIAKNKLHIKTIHQHNRVLNYNVIHQMLCILPPYSKELVPEEAQPLYLDQSPIIDQFPEDFLLDTDGKHAEFMAHALVPHADLERIVVAVESVKFKRGTLKSLTNEKSNVWIHKRRTQDEAIYNRPITSNTRFNNFEISKRVISKSPMLKIPLAKRLKKGEISQITLDPKGRLFKVKPTPEELPPHIPTIDLLMQIGLEPFKIGSYKSYKTQKQEKEQEEQIIKL